MIRLRPVSGVPVNTYTGARFLGFKRLPSSSLVGLFKVEGIGIPVTKLYREPVSLKELNELRRAVGLHPLRPGDRIALPEPGDRNMLGYTRRLRVFLILKESGYYDITQVRPVTHRPDSFRAPECDPDTGELIEYTPAA